MPERDVDNRRGARGTGRFSEPGNGQLGMANAVAAFIVGWRTFQIASDQLRITGAINTLHPSEALMIAGPAP